MPRPKGYSELWVDGSCQGNPGGHSGAGVILKTAKEDIFQAGFYLGRMTSNEAEYAALVAGLRLLEKHGVKKVKIYTDSELMHHQVLGMVRTKTPSLLTYQETIRELLNELEEWTLNHVPRSQNSGADVLATRAALTKKDSEREYDSQKAAEKQLDNLDDLLDQSVDIGTPWGSLGAWPKERPGGVLLQYDRKQKGWYVTDAHFTKLIWLGALPIPQQWDGS